MFAKRIERTTETGLLFSALLSGVLALSACGGIEEAPPAERQHSVETLPSDMDQATKADAAKLAPLVTLSTDQAAYTESETIQASLKNGFKKTVIYVQGCVVTVVQKKEQGAWVDQPSQVACLWEGFAGSVKPEETHMEPVGPLPAGTYRLKASTKRGCLSETTFGACDPAGTTLKTVFSAELTVLGKPATTSCGGYLGKMCPSGQVCADDPTDSCDLAHDADCMGLCVDPASATRCAGFVGLTCPSGQVCLDDPTDSCDPQNGGADCSGFCVAYPNATSPVGSTKQSACKQGQYGPSLGLGTVKASVQGSTALITHEDARHNCASKITMEVGFTLNGDLVVQEIITNPDEAAYCFCPFDLSVEVDVSKLGPGVHTVEVHNADGALVGTATITL